MKSHFKSKKAKEAYQQFYEQKGNYVKAALHKNWAETPSGKTYYLESGVENRKVLLYFHGNGESALSAKPFHEEFSGRYRVISVDMMWQLGQSIAHKAMDKSQGYTPWILELLDYFEVERVTLAGFSYGAWIAGRFALDQPSFVERLILVSPAASFQPIEKAYYNKLYRLAFFPTKKNMMDCLQFWFGPDNPVSSFAIEQMEMQFSLCKLKAPPLVPGVFSDQELRSLPMPVQLIMGSQEGTTDPQKSLARANELIKNIRTCSIEGGAHYLDVTHRETMVKEIHDFMGG